MDELSVFVNNSTLSRRLRTQQSQLCDGHSLGSWIGQETVALPMPDCLPHATH